MSSLSIETKIEKVDKMKHIVSGPVLSPDVPDLQDDVLSRDEIEKVAHEFLIQIQQAAISPQTIDKSSQVGQIGVEHLVFKGIGAFGYVVESYINEFGQWILAVKITNDQVWKLVLENKITGFSIGGQGVRTKIGGEMN